MEELKNVCLCVGINVWNRASFLSPPQSLGFAKFHTDVGTDFPYALFLHYGKKNTFVVKKYTVWK